MRQHWLSNTSRTLCIWLRGKDGNRSGDARCWIKAHQQKFFWLGDYVWIKYFGVSLWEKLHQYVVSVALRVDFYVDLFCVGFTSIFARNSGLNNTFSFILIYSGTLNKFYISLAMIEVNKSLKIGSHPPILRINPF